MRAEGETASAAAVRLATSLRDSYLPMQGPPGTGKTYTAAGQILELIADGRTAGITGPSHAVICHLIDTVYEHATWRGAGTPRIGQRADRDKDGGERPVSPDNVLIVTPYNAQIRAIVSALAAGGQSGFRVGTVDKFQGREAPVVIYSMATSSAGEAPRGLEFLYDLHRLNVATSRARALAIIVASPDLIRVSCRTPQQMVLANALCRAWETRG